MSDLNSYFLVSQLFQVYCPKVAVSPTLLLKTAFIYTSVLHPCTPPKTKVEPKNLTCSKQKRKHQTQTSMFFFGCMCPLEQLFRLYRGSYYSLPVFFWVHNERFVRISTWNVTWLVGVFFRDPIGLIARVAARRICVPRVASQCEAGLLDWRVRAPSLVVTAEKVGRFEGIHRGKTAISQEKFSEMW